ncbi:hypothetical protein HFN88_33735 [Rhizobium laguerreae]|uniref:hypothetical protein n=1 Tax=Rhizobium laguerreae TaxID=1076926 RepID=UPI001C927071|nr:hypothetical protein [Rhizobium laguerreae]MBY3266793.1 hypothetical protein [Rhizobium laguerreae]MBY3328813.1 hypothetical protein [Rhizobium laguerreae]MBY3342013.1 hypothetical protein [Rhizobium laguerreae]MBY3397581.1 hypothetical protein [Rhizobium laguerreae]
MNTTRTDTVDSSSNPSNGVDVLDVVLILAKSIRVMIAIPLLGFSIVLAFFFLLPPRFESEALVRMPIERTLLLQSASFLDDAVKTNQWLLTQYDKQYQAREKFRKSLRVVNISGTDIYRLQYIADTPAHAEQALSSILAQLLAASRPSPDRQEELKTKLLSQTNLQQTLQKLLERLSGSIPVQENPPTEVSGQAVLAIADALEKFNQAILATETSLKGSVSASDILQGPTRPDEPLAKGSLAKAIGVAAVLFLIMLMWAFVREAFQRAALDKSGLKKIERIKSLLSARRPRSLKA